MPCRKRERLASALSRLVGRKMEVIFDGSFRQLLARILFFLLVLLVPIVAFVGQLTLKELTRPPWGGSRNFLDWFCGPMGIAASVALCVAIASVTALVIRGKRKKKL